MRVKVVLDEVLPVADGSALDCVALGSYGASRTVQHHRDACDIPSIVAKYKSTGVLPRMKAVSDTGAFGDFSDVAEYQEVCNRVLRSQEAFADLPVRVRERFKNDPVELLSFLGNPANRDEAIALGLVPAPVLDDALSVKKVGDVTDADAKGV